MTDELDQIKLAIFDLSQCIQDLSCCIPATIESEGPQNWLAQRLNAIHERARVVGEELR